MSFANRLYNAVFRRNSRFVGTVFVTAFFYDLAFNSTMDKIFDNLNKGKQWKDIRGKYIAADEADDDDDE